MKVVIDGEEHINCDPCCEEDEPEVDAEYTCEDCDEDICFDHLKVWPQPKEMIPIHYCKTCYDSRWGAWPDRNPISRRKKQ